MELAVSVNFLLMYMLLLLQTSSTFQLYILSICKWPFQLISVILLVNNNNGYFFYFILFFSPQNAF